MRYSEMELRQFATRLKEWRGALGLQGQKDAAAKISVPYRTYQNWEGAKNAPTPEHLSKLRAAGAPIPGDTDGLAEFEERVLRELADLRRLLEDDGDQSGG